jgi:uncharacterized protein (DUF3820 family)
MCQIGFNVTIMKMPFGKYAGLSLAEIAKTDPSYLRWVARNATAATSTLKKECLKVLNPPPDNSVEVDNLKDTIEKLEKNLQLVRDENDLLRFQLQYLQCKQQDLSWWPGWFNRAVKLAHPDRAGDARIMALLNEANEKLKQQSR